MPSPPASHLIPAVPSLAQAEQDAIAALAAFINSPEGRGAGDQDLKLWLFERGWNPNKLKAWTERIAALAAVADPHAADPRLIAHRLDHRLERLAHRAEDMNDMKHAIAATEAQAKLHRLGGFAPAAGAAVTVNVTASTAHLVSDDELAKIAKQAEAVVVHPSPEDDPLFQ
jgi:hypothetical protein